MPSFPTGWRTSPDGTRVEIALKTKSFLDALDLFQAIGEVAEELDHHPDLHLEGYNRVRIASYSHDVGRLTERDERLVRRLDALLQARGLAALDVPRG